MPINEFFNDDVPEAVRVTCRLLLRETLEAEERGDPSSILAAGSSGLASPWSYGIEWSPGARVRVQVATLYNGVYRGHATGEVGDTMLSATSSVLGLPVDPQEEFGEDVPHQIREEARELLRKVYPLALCAMPSRGDAAYRFAQETDLEIECEGIPWYVNAFLHGPGFKKYKFNGWPYDGVFAIHISTHRGVNPRYSGRMYVPIRSTDRSNEDVRILAMKRLQHALDSRAELDTKIAELRREVAMCGEPLSLWDRIAADTEAS